MSSLGWWKGSLPVAGGWNEMVCKVPSNPNHSVTVSRMADVVPRVMWSQRQS